MTRTAGIAVTCVLVAAVTHHGEASASGTGDHSVAIAASAQKMRGADGDRLQADWIGRFSAGTLSVGLSRSTAGSSNWSLVRVSGAHPRPGGILVVGDIETGPATINGTDVTFTMVRAGVHLAPAANWRFRVGSTYLDLAPVSGSLLSGAASLSISEVALLDFELTQSASGNLDQRQITVRYDNRGPSPHFSAGITLGTSNSEPDLYLPDISTRTQRHHSGFVALGLPVNDANLVVALESGSVAGTRRTTISLSLNVPLGDANAR